MGIDIDACLPWWGRCGVGGYGVVRQGRGFGTEYAHRRIYEEAFGPIPDGMHVLHRCDNPPCVNPAHLFLGTRSDNLRDAMEKGRWSPGRKPAGIKWSRSRTDEEREDIAARMRDVWERRRRGEIPMPKYRKR